MAEEEIIEENATPVEGETNGYDLPAEAETVEGADAE